MLAAWPECRFAVGVHPHHAKVFDVNPQAAADKVAERLDRLPEARAIGEIGLDYHYDFSPRDVQHAVFRVQLHLAIERDLTAGDPHARSGGRHASHPRREEGHGRLRGVFHCFTGDTGGGRTSTGDGFILSIPGVVTFPKAETLRQSAAPLRRRIGCWLKPTAPISRRFRTAASATSRPTWRRWSTNWRPCAAPPPWRLANRPIGTSTGCSGRSGCKALCSKH